MSGSYDDPGHRDCEFLDRRVLVIDPGNFTPGYDINLGIALKRRGWGVSWITAPHAFAERWAPDGLDATVTFMRCLRHRSILRLSKRFPTLRRLVRLIDYPISMSVLSGSLARGAAGIVHVQWALFPICDSVFWRLWKRMGWKVVLTVHDPRPLAGSLPRILGEAVSLLLSTADAVIVHGETARRELQDRLQEPSRIHIVPPGSPALVDGEKRVHDSHSARLELGIPADVHVVLFFGFIKDYKGFDLLLRSLAPLAAKHPKAFVVAAGKLMNSRLGYTKLIRDLGIGDSLRWHDDYVPAEMVHNYFTAADVVVLPYRDASHSGVLLMAWHYGKPVVATAVGGTTDLLDHGVNGLMVPPRDPESLSDALARVLADRELARRMGANGRRLIEGRHSWTRIAQQTEAVYSRLLRPAPDGGTDA